MIGQGRGVVHFRCSRAWKSLLLLFHTKPSPVSYCTTELAEFRKPSARPTVNSKEMLGAKYFLHLLSAKSVKRMQI